MAGQNPSVKITEEALKWARRASGFTDESVISYISRVVIEQGKADVERLSKEALKEKPQKGKG